MVKHDGADVDCIEYNYTLGEILTAKGHHLIGRNFMEDDWTAIQYDRILMNPPFENGQDIDHVRRAFDFIKPGGRLVAIMSEGPFFRSEKKATDFREWLTEVGVADCEKLGNVLPTATRLVVIDKE